MALNYEQVNMKISPGAYEKLIAIKKVLEAAEQRQVTYSEVIDRLAALWTQEFKIATAEQAQP